MADTVTTLSVIIPTLNEAGRIEEVLSALSAEVITTEIIVADGGSTDGTAAIVREAEAILIECERGRGNQLHQGAAAATGDILFFLHADTKLPKGALTAILEELRAYPDAGGGNFRLLFDGDTKFSRWLIGFYKWIRSRGFYYGDSGIFVRRKVYEKIGPIKAIPLMEDFEFTRRLEHFGPTICIEEPPLVTSSRKFQGRHPIAIVWGWLFIHALWYLGVKPKTLARFYYGKRA
ncbi:MAG: glycosyltransferase [Alphaproteobacteria bacterium]|nr:glycosyltransferase [Alphaproteobacteria bacterium]